MEGFQELVHSVLRIEGSLNELLRHNNTFICPYCCGKHLTAGTAVDQAEETPLEPWMDAEAVMRYLKISRRTLYRLMETGTIRPRRIGKCDCFFPSDLKEAFAQSIRKGRA